MSDDYNYIGINAPYNTIKNDYYDPTKPMVNEYLKGIETMYDNRGKYFDQYLFNKKFDEYIEKTNKERLLKQNVRLYDLDKIENIKISPYELPLNKLLIKIKDAWFSLFDNLINYRYPLINITNDDFFYFGITLVIISIIYILLYYIFS
jgi:hypothetical protein